MIRPQQPKWISNGLVVSALLAHASLASAQTIIPDVQNAQCSDNALDSIFDYLENALDPVTENHANITPLPRRKVFVPASQRSGLSQKRIVMFGDLFPINKDMAPHVSDEVRALLTKADLVLGNIEAPVTYNGGWLETDSNMFFNFHANVAFVKSAMAQYCMDPAKSVFTVANNHADDWSRWTETVEYSPLLHSTIVGIDHNEAWEPEITIKDVGDLRVGIVAWTHLENNAPERDASGQIIYPTWEASKRVMAQTNWEQRKSALGLDLLIGMPHWDCQFNYFPRQETVDAANALHLKGFDLIVGSHAGLQPAIAHPGGELSFLNLGALVFGYGINKNAMINAVEMVVDGTGRVLEYQLHSFVSQKVNPSTTWVRAVNTCGSRTVLDWPRQTEWRVVTFDWLRQNGTDQDRQDLQSYETVLDMVFPL